MPATMTIVRQIKAEEWSTLRSIRLAALRDAPEAFSESLSEVEAMSAESWQGRAQRGAKGETSFTTLAFAGDQAIGMAVGLADHNDPSRAYLAAMWVTPDWRGTDAASLLVDSVACWATARGSENLFCGVLDGNARAVAFYRKAGFIPHMGSTPDHPATQGSGLVLSLKLR